MQFAGNWFEIRRYDNDIQRDWNCVSFDLEWIMNGVSALKLDGTILEPESNEHKMGIVYTLQPGLNQSEFRVIWDSVDSESTMKCLKCKFLN